MTAVGDIVPHGSFYHVDWQGYGWWQRLLTIPDPTETAIIALQHVDVELARDDDSFNHATDLIIGFAVGKSMQEALARLTTTEGQAPEDMSGVVARRLGRLFQAGPMTDLIFATATERGLSRVVFSIPDDKPDTRYEQFAKQFNFKLDTSGPQRMWVISYPFTE